MNTLQVPEAQVRVGLAVRFAKILRATILLVPERRVETVLHEPCLTRSTLCALIRSTSAISLPVGRRSLRASERSCRRAY